MVSVSGGDDRIAIALLAGVIDLDRDAGQALEHELSRLRGVPTGSAGSDIDLLQRAELGFGDLHFVQEDLTGVLRDSAQRGVTHSAGLLVDFFQHEVLEPALFGHDRVPGDVLHLAHDGPAGEVGELNTVGRDAGNVAIGWKNRSRV